MLSCFEVLTCIHNPIVAVYKVSRLLSPTNIILQFLSQKMLEPYSIISTLKPLKCIKQRHGCVIPSLKLQEDY